MKARLGMCRTCDFNFRVSYVHLRSKLKASANVTPHATRSATRAARSRDSTRAREYNI